jgi:hypothetical protein
MSTHYMKNNVSIIRTCHYVNMCGTAHSLTLTQCSDVNDSLYNETAVIHFTSPIYCLCVLTEQHRDRRNIKYKQQTETRTQEVITNHKAQEIT